MCPSTEDADAGSFAAEALRKLLRRIDERNLDADAAAGHYTFLVSHAWTDGPMMYLVYQAPPSDITWGLVRDTRESLTDPSPWSSVDEAATYYYLLDLEEGWPGTLVRQPGEPDTIRWFGDIRDGLPVDPSTISDAHRHTPEPGDSEPKSTPGHQMPATPRRYANRVDPEATT